MLFGGRGSLVGSAMVPLDRALLSFSKLFIVAIPLSVTVWPRFAIQILTGGFDPKCPLPTGDQGPCLIVLFGTT